MVSVAYMHSIEVFLKKIWSCRRLSTHSKLTDQIDTVEFPAFVTTKKHLCCWRTFDGSTVEQPSNICLGFSNITVDWAVANTSAHQLQSWMASITANDTHNSFEKSSGSFANQWKNGTEFWSAAAPAATTITAIPYGHRPRLVWHHVFHAISGKRRPIHERKSQMYSWHIHWEKNLCCRHIALKNGLICSTLWIVITDLISRPNFVLLTVEL